MQLKSFTGTSNKDVLDQIKSELGAEAVILDSRTHTRNGRKVITMTAALERQEEEVAPHTFAATGGTGSKSWAKNVPVGWQEEWSEIKSYLLTLMKPALELEKLGSRQKVAMEYLEREGANNHALLELYRRLIKGQEVPVLDTLAKLVPMRPWSYENWPQRVHLIAGPYGSGKTSIAVRMAIALLKSPAARGRSGRICIVNADADRGSGRLLLRHYTGLSDLIYREASNAIEMAGVLAEIGKQGFDRVLVDMPGIPRGTTLAETVKDFGLDRLDTIQTALHLVMSPHYAESSVSSMLERYQLDMPGSLIWSKLDEADKYGAILNAAVACTLPISCLSFGPGLLNTLCPVETGALWRLIFKHEIPMMNTAFAGFGDNYE